MHHATNRVKGFYAKTKKPARLNSSFQRDSKLTAVYVDGCLFRRWELQLPRNRLKSESGFSP